MKIIESSHTVELTRRNLESLLAKLNGHPPNSACRLDKDSEEGNIWRIIAVENNVHYSDRAPGVIHPLTAKHIYEEN